MTNFNSQGNLPNMAAAYHSSKAYNLTVVLPFSNFIGTTIMAQWGFV
jgi:hypothetical protein